MSYTTAAQTRAFSQTWLTHILDLFGTDTLNIKLGLMEESTFTLVNFIGPLADELGDMEWPHESDDSKTKPLNRAEKRLLRNIHAWVIWVQTIFLGINFFMLDMDDYSSYLMLRNMTPVAPPTPAPAAPLQIQIPPTPAQSRYLPPASFMPNV